MSAYSSPLFLSEGKVQGKPRWGSFAVSYMVQILALLGLFFYTIVTPRIEPPETDHVQLVAPDLTPWEQAPPPKPVTRPVVRIEPSKVILPTPKIETPVVHVLPPQRVQRITAVAEIAQPQAAVPAPKFDSKVLTALPGPKATSRIVATNTFGGSSATPTLSKLAPGKVQTGGFGDPNGVPTNANPSHHPNLAAAGSFDLPPGGGYGNGSGGSKGVRGTVASAGFGNGVAVQGGGSGGKGRVQASSGFVAATVAAPNPEDARRLKASTQQGATAPVTIQSKPTPIYTAEARQLRVEGEVLLNVIFTADGQIRVLSVVRGLGHGLDEAAQRAARGVRFSPAMRDGHPVDSNATLHIIFQLS
jgi:TonB family protein